MKFVLNNFNFNLFCIIFKLRRSSQIIKTSWTLELYTKWLLTLYIQITTDRSNLKIILRSLKKKFWNLKLLKNQLYTNTKTYLPTPTEINTASVARQFHLTPNTTTSHNPDLELAYTPIHYSIRSYGSVPYPPLNFRPNY